MQSKKEILQSIRGTLTPPILETVEKLPIKNIEELLDASEAIREVYEIGDTLRRRLITQFSMGIITGIEMANNASMINFCDLLLKSCGLDRTKEIFMQLIID